MSEYKRKLDRAERLPLWPSIEFQSSCPFLSSVKSKYSQTDWTKWDKQSPSRGSCHSKRNMAAWRCPGRAPSATVLQVILFFLGGGRWGGREKRKEGRTHNPHIHRDFPYATSSKLHSLNWVFGHLLFSKDEEWVWSFVFLCLLFLITTV